MIDAIYSVGQELYSVTTEFPDLMDKKQMKIVAMLTNTDGCIGLFNTARSAVWLYKGLKQARRAIDTINKYGGHISEKIDLYVVGREGFPEYIKNIIPEGV